MIAAGLNFGAFGARCLGWFKNSASGDCSLASLEVSRQFLDILREHSALLSGGDLSGGKEIRDRGAGSGVRDVGRCDEMEGVRADEDDVAKVSALVYVLVIDDVFSPSVGPFWHLS
jgi:hypothetical protein